MSTLDNLQFYDWCLNNSQYGRYLLDECTDKSVYEKEFNSTEVTEWKCFRCSNTWTTSLESRTRLENFAKCPKCNNGFHYKMIPAARVKQGSISLLDYCRSDGEYALKIYKEYIGYDDKRNYYPINEISYGSHKKIKWQCIDCGHKWYASILNRTTNKSGCPACTGRVVTDKNSLESWCKINGSWGEKLLKEFIGICEDGKHYKIDEISHGTDKKILWKCETCSHEWYDSIIHRTISKRGCPECSTKGTSYTEQLIYHSIKQIFPKTESRYKILKEECSRGIEFDIAIPTADSFIFIEYSPTYWHNYREERDRLKREICQSKGVRLIEVIDDSYDELDETWESNLVITNIEKLSKREEIIFKITDFILKSLGHSIDEIDVEKAKSDAWNSSKGKIEYEKSLEYAYPELAKEWHPYLNGDLKPSDVTYGSHKEPYWQCQHCGHGKNGEWKSIINNRRRKRSICPKCGYSWYKATQGLSQKLKKRLYLFEEYPELAKEWHPTLNVDIMLSDVTSGSNKEPYWQCQHCGHGKNGEWQSRISSRTSKKNGCPKCGYSWYKATQGLPQNIKISLSDEYPELAKEWHPYLNGDLKPSDVTSESGKEPYWQCPNCNHGKNGEWQSIIYSRTHYRNGCPSCGYNWYKSIQRLPQKLKRL